MMATPSTKKLTKVTAIAFGVFYGNCFVKDGNMILSFYDHYGI